MATTGLAYRASKAALLAVFATQAAQAQTALLERHGDSAGDRFGSAVAALGDVDADGVRDFAIGAPNSDLAANDAGLVRVYSGRTQQVLASWTGAASGQHFGASIADAGDLDSDGHDDVLIGADGADYAQVRSGASGAVLRTLSGPSATGFGAAVAGGGLVDADSVPDLLVGAPHSDFAGAWSGSTYVFSGATGALIRRHDGGNPFAALGWSVAFLGDVTGDSRSEYGAGSPALYFSGAGQLDLFDGASGTLLWSDTNAAWNDEYGWALAAIADVSGDGLPDLLAGAPQDPGVGCGGCTGSGFVRALDGANGAMLWQRNGAGLYAGLGSALASTGDLNGNGFADFAVAQPSSEGCGANTMSLQVRDGRNGALIVALPPPSAGDMFGNALAFADVNGDGLVDLACGAPCESTSGALAGAVFGYTIVRNVQSYCSSTANSLGCTPLAEGLGTPSASATASFDVRATNVLNQKNGLCFYGFKPRKTPFPGGYMCVVAPLSRTPLQNSGGTPAPANDCSGVFSIDFNARIQSGIDPHLVSGETVFAQYWSRDPAAPSHANLTGGVAFYIGL